MSELKFSTPHLAVADILPLKLPISLTGKLSASLGRTKDLTPGGTHYDDLCPGLCLLFRR